MERIQVSLLGFYAPNRKMEAAAHLDLATRLARAGVGNDSAWGSASTPIYQTAIFEHKRPLTAGNDAYNYTRIGNPTRTALQDVMRDLEGGAGSLAFTSGMGAIAATFQLFQFGDHIIATEGLYGHTYGLLASILQPLGIKSTFVDTSSIDAVKAAWTDRTAAVFLEVPSNPLLKAADIPAIAELCNERKAKLIVDSTFLTPWCIRPLELGADIVVHSSSYYLAGHNDTISGVVTARSSAVIEDLTYIQMLTGGALSPHDAWLTLRGIKTLALRMERCQENALRIATWLLDHPAVQEVHYPGLPDHPSHDVLKAQSTGFGGVVSFTTRTVEGARAALNNTRLILLAESLGGTETLITYPWTQTHGSIPPDERERLGINDRLVRLAVGIESCDDLIADLDQALGG